MGNIVRIAEGLDHAGFEIPLIKSDLVPCDLCGSFDNDVLYSKIDPVTGGEFHLVRCQCGMAYVNPMPTEQSIALLYPDEYLDKKELQNPIYHKMLELLPKNGGKSLLDIGCGRGHFVHHAIQAGWQANGVDLLSWKSDFQVPIVVGDFLQMAFPQGSYDVVTAWAVLEHVRQPSLFFRKISEVLNRDGRFVFVVPNISAPGAQYSCAEDIPRHLWLFTPDTAKQYLCRFGMEIVDIKHDGAIYTSYPFGLVRRAVLGRGHNGSRCREFQNKSVALLRNRQIKGNFRNWLSEVFTTLPAKDIAVDMIDLSTALITAYVSKLMKNYGVMTVIARKIRRPRFRVMERRV